MSDQFTDIKIVEANRLHSEEAKSGNNENFSLWTNNLQDILFLEPQDKISVYGSFISERGAGQTQAIEIKGQELNQVHEFQYINIKKIDYVKDNPLGYQYKREDAEYIVKKHQLRDDTLKFTINYFIPANAHNSLHLPRRWMHHIADPRDNFFDNDSRSVQGVSLTYYDVSNTILGAGFWQKPAFYKTVENDFEERIIKPNNDNERYTLLIRDHTYYDQATALANLPDAPSLRDPEAETYQIYRELKEIKIPAGFNSAEFLATEITRQFQNIVNEETIKINKTGKDNFPLEVMKIIESETYKAFNTGNIPDNTRENFLRYFDLVGPENTVADKQHRAGWNKSEGYEWLRQYQIVATKFPELYEKGRLINRFSNQSYSGIRGSRTRLTYTGQMVNGLRPGIELAIPYNKDRCDEYKAFFDAQTLYPEIINNLNEPHSGYIPGNSIDNTRWMHINRFENASQYVGDETPTISTTQLGWGGYHYPRTWQPNKSTQQLCSMLMCLFFKPEDKDTFYDNPRTDELGQYTYGCLGRSANGYIIIYPDRHQFNGFGTAPFTEILRPIGGLVNPGIEGNRKLGFDLHFNAPGMYYLLPLSGHTKYTNPTSSVATTIGDYSIPNNEQNATNVAPEYDVDPVKRKLYIGADKPSLDWDGTYFSFQGFHTGLNRGNHVYAGLPIGSIGPEEGFEDVIYKINPVEQFIDWTPDRTPYQDDYSIYPSATALAAGKMTIKRINDNYEKWRVYDQLCGIMVEDFGIPEDLWDNSLWGLLGFSYKQFHSSKNNRNTRIQFGNANDLSVLTTNSEVVEGDTKLLNTNWAGTPLLTNMINTPANIFGYTGPADPRTKVGNNQVYPPIENKTQSISIIADRLPTRMIRGYYTIRSNILDGTPFIGGKVNNTTMPVIGVVDKINGDGDFYFGQESSLNFTITKPLRIASLSIGIHDPDGSYANTSEQSTILFKIEKPKITTFNIAREIMEQEQSKPQK